MSEPFTSLTIRVFPNGNTATSWPMVMSPAGMEVLIPPPLVRAISASVKSSMASVASWPRLLSPVLTMVLSPTRSTFVFPTTLSRIGFCASSTFLMSSAMVASGVTLAKSAYFRRLDFASFTLLFSSVSSTLPMFFRLLPVLTIRVSPSFTPASVVVWLWPSTIRSMPFTFLATMSDVS